MADSSILQVQRKRRHVQRISYAVCVSSRRCCLLNADQVDDRFPLTSSPVQRGMSGIARRKSGALAGTVRIWCWTAPATSVTAPGPEWCGRETADQKQVGQLHSAHAVTARWLTVVVQLVQRCSSQCGSLQMPQPAGPWHLSRLSGVSDVIVAGDENSCWLPLWCAA